MEEILPNKLSDLLELAIKDLKEVMAEEEVNPHKIKIDMGIWHSPVTDINPCTVCLAGCVLRQTIKVPDTVSLLLKDVLTLSEDLCRKCLALDYAKYYNWFRALIQLKCEVSEFSPVILTLNREIEPTAYFSTDRKQFITNMEHAVEILRRHQF